MGHHKCCIAPQTLVLTPAPAGMTSNSDNSPTLTPPGMGRTNPALTDSVTQAATKSLREGMRAPHLYFSVQETARQSSTSRSRDTSLCSHSHEAFLMSHISGTDDGKSGCGENLSGFDGLSERHFKAEENVQIIKRPISVMHFQMAIIHLMPKRRKDKKTQRTIRKMLWLTIVLSSLQSL